MRRRAIVLFASALLFAAPMAQTQASANGPPPPPGPSTSGSASTAPAVNAAVVGGGTWNWQNPKPNANLLFAITCPTTSICYAAGENGPILKTTDGGASWTQQASEIGVFALACATTTNCVGVGLNGLALWTSDGGANWTTTLNVDSSSNLFGVACRSTTACAAVGQAGTIEATTNGGTSWSAVASGTTADFRAVSCAVNRCVAVATGGQLAQSLCATCGWTPFMTGTTEDLNGVDCPTDTSCVAVGDHGTVLTLYDSSASWFASSIGPSVTLIGVDCTTVNECVATSAIGDAYIRQLGAWGPATVGESGTLWSASCPATGTCFVAGDNGLIARTTNGGTGWAARGPGSFNTDFHDVACVTSVSCFVAGNAAVLHTADGGDTWARQPLPSPAAFLNGITCPAATTCVAVGQQAAIVRTTDSGATWTTVNPAVVGQELQSISCPSTTQCVAVGFSGNVMTTSDGVSWQSRTPGTNVNLWDVSCPTTSVCIAVGDINNFSATVIKSTDGGVTWTLNSNPRWSPHGVSCVDASNCVIVGGTSEILTTSNGGSTWTDRSPSTNLGAFSDVSCTSATRCWILGYAEGTFDGTTFTQQTIPSAGANTWNAIGCIANTTSSTCLIVGGGTLVARSVDAGATWAVVMFPPTNLTDISCAGVANCVAVGGPRVQTTSNSGATWTARLFPGATFKHVVCPSTSECFAAANATDGSVEVFKSTDAGATWSPISTAVVQPVAGLSCPDTSNCFLSMSNGQVMRTSDAGTTWAIVATASGTGGSEISCPSATTCYLAGASAPGHIYRSTDSGTTWSLAFDLSTDAQAGSGAAFSSIACPTSTVCSAGGLSGLIASTTDGVNWRTDTLFDFAFDVNDVSCPSADTCFAATPSAAILQSTDYGGDWSTQFGSSFPLGGGGGATASFNAISCPTTQVCYAAGDAGNVVGTTTGGAAWTHSSPSGVYLDTRSASCPTLNDCYATVGDSGIDPGGLLYSHDGGSTWTLRRLNQADTAIGISCPAAATCYTVGWPGSIYKTTDGGTTMVYEQSAFSEADKNLESISCPTVTTCYAVGVLGTILSTTDGGSTWQQPAAPPTTSSLFSVSCATTASCVAVGHGGVSVSLAGGTWQAHSTPVTTSLNAVSCPTASRCYAAGSAGSVLLTTDQGVSWTLQSSGVGTNLNLLGITCPQSTACVAVGGFGTVIVTEDGSTWTSIPEPDLNTIRAVTYVNPAHGWLFGLGGAVLVNAGFLNYCLNAGGTPSPGSPQVAGNLVMLTASSVGCTDPRYQFEMLAPGSQTWQVVQAFSANNVFSWNTAGAAPGSYKFIVKARDANSPGLAGSSTGAWDSYSSLSFTLTTQACTGVTASSSPAGTAVSGTTVTITGSATACPNPRYQFEMLAPGSQTWQVVQPYSPSAAFNWSTAGAVQGTYRFIVKARDLSSAGVAGSSTGSWDAYAVLTFTLTGIVCSSVTTQTSPSGTALSGTMVTITAAASGCPNALYQFEVFFPGPNLWKVIQAYSPSNTYSWNTTGSGAGSHKFIVKARDASSSGAMGSGPGAWDSYVVVNYTLTSIPCTGVTAATSGNTITATASGCPSPQYQFEMQAPGSAAWVVVQPYSSNASFNATGMAKGTYKFIVKARDASSIGTAGSSNSNGSWDVYFLGTLTVS